MYIGDSADELELSNKECLLLLLPIFGLSDAGDHWDETLKGHLKDDPGMISTKTDPSLYFNFNKEGDLIAINVAYINDMLREGHGPLKAYVSRHTTALKPLVTTRYHFHLLDLRSSSLTMVHTRLISHIMSRKI